MITFVSHWFGIETIADEEMKALRGKTEQAIMRATLYFEGKVKLKLNAEIPRTGRMYGEHQASAPGEPPAPLSGELRQSITHTDVVWNGDQASAEVGTNLDYAARLEFGGTDSRGIRILPRPYFSATWLEEEATMQEMLDQAVSSHPVFADISAQSSGSSGRLRDARGRFMKAPSKSGRARNARGQFI